MTNEKEMSDEEMNTFEHSFIRGFKNPTEKCPYSKTQEVLVSGWLNGQKYYEESKKDAERLANLLKQGHTPQEAGKIILEQVCKEIVKEH